jgi:hypothetical protein
MRKPVAFPDLATDWRGDLRQYASLGSLTQRPGSLAGLHQARQAHRGQFWTSAPLAAWIWAMVSPAMDRALASTEGRYRVPVLDTSCGTGALLQFADPARHELAGVDPHKPSVVPLVQAAQAAGFAAHFAATTMEQIDPTGYGVALINPPYSLHLEAPTLVAGPATCYGRFGPDTSALSHVYAVQQALAAADIVTAVLPRSYADTLIQDPAAWPRLVAIFHAPAWCFREQGADVRVSVAFFDRHPRALGAPVLVEVLASDLSGGWDLGLSCRTKHSLTPRLRERGIIDEGPTITRPVTGSRAVHLGHSGSRITLGFACGLMEARVRNAVLRERLVPLNVPGHRYPRHVRYLGQGALDLEAHLVQNDPLSSLEALFEVIRGAGADLTVDPGLLNYVRRRARRLAIERTPFRHTVLVRADMARGGVESVVGQARKMHLVNPAVWGSPVIKAGQEVAFTPAGDGTYGYRVAGRDFSITEAELNDRFAVCAGQASDRWETVHPGRLDVFPDLAASLRQRGEALGLDRFLSWDYQFEDLLELAMARGGVAAWAVGLGKARLSAGLILMSGCKAGLICTEAYLIDEMRTELGKLPIPAEDWQVIEGPGQLRTLRRINVISYHRLRAPINRAHARRTYASRMRRRIGCLVADEGDLLRNKGTAQTNALWQIAAKRQFVLSGTPIGNYPRDCFPVLAFTGGDATAAQPYGMRRWFLDPAVRWSTQFAVPGVDEVRDRFVTLEWVTNEFADELKDGAKREVPKLQHIPEYRAVLAPHVKRRVAQEPDVARHFHIPVPQRRVQTLDWHEDHLAYYLEVAEDFRQWYLKGREHSRDLNLVALLARIQAVQIAAAIPQRRSEKSPFRYAGGLTSKQEYAVERLATLAGEGHKIIAYAEWPDLLDLIGNALSRRGVENVVIHGGKPIGERVRALDEGFRFGPAPVLLASLGVAQKGLNIPQADRLMFLTRAWTAKTEEQAEGRVLRPQQTREVVGEFVHLAGSIDEYQGQMVAHKRDAIGAGLDWGTQDLADVDFLHLDTILGRFVDDLAKMLGCRHHELRKRLVA